MLKDEKGEFSLVAVLALLFGSALFVGAVALNSTDNSSFNFTIEDSVLINLSNISAVENISLNQTINLTIPIINDNQSTISNETSNITVPIEINQSINLTLNNTIGNQTLNETINITFPKKAKNLSEIIEKHKSKLNDETKKYLKELKDKKEEKEFIVKFRKFIDKNKLSNVTLEGEIGKFKLTKIRGEVEDIQNLIEDDEIEFLELEQNVEILGDNIPFNIKKIKADSAWDSSKGSNVKVAVLDTGIGLHNDLAVEGGISFVDNNYYDGNGHGTAVAGVISALLNDGGLVGVAPSVDLYSVKIMQGPTGDLSNAISGIEWAINNSMDIVSMSFGFDSYSQIFKEVLQEAYNNNILFIAASGNNGQDNILYPAKYDTVIAVGAVDSNDNLASFSSYGFEQELVAPGVDINSTSLGNGYSVSSGTSLAAPHVAGVAALIKSYNNSLTNEQIRAKLRNDALDLGTAGKDDVFGYGLVQVKLNTTNLTLTNLSYFYEIFNISNFGLPNITYTFWTSGNGTIDNVNFMPGYYLVNLTFNTGLRKSNIYNVSENRSIFILSSQVIYDDFFSTDGGTFTDGIAWINDNITIKISSNTLSTIEVECFTVGPGQQFNTFDYCFGDTQAHMDECDSGDPDILCDSTHTQCSIVGTTGQPREIISYNFAHTNNSYGRAYGDCTFPGSTQETTGSLPYYIVEKKAARCINSSHYNVSGWHGDNWIKIAQSSCGSGYKCVNSSNFTTESGYINPCISETTCTGTIQVVTEDRNGNAMSGLLVSRDEVSNKTTDSVGVTEYSLSKTCGQNMEFKVYCSNTSGATLCGTKTAKLDVVNDYEGLLFDCSICSGSPDMQIDVDNVKVNKAANNITINISLAGSVSGTNINLTLKVQGKDGLISREASQLFDISGGSFKSINQTITLNDNDDFLHVYIDTTNKVTESNEKNNYALVPLFKPQINAYLSVSTGYESIDSEIKKFLKLYVNEVASQSQANVTIAVGLPKKNIIIESKNSFTQKNYQWFFTHSIYYNNKPLGSKPYNGIVGAFRDDYNYIIVGGNDIDGLLAALKRLISARSLFFSELKKDKVKVIEDTDTAGISVADLLRNPSNKPYYNQRGSDAFANVVSRVLNNNNFEITVKTVQTLNTTSYNQSTILRLKNVNSDFSSNYKDVVVNGSKPVVMSAGIFSTLITWEDNGKGLARDLVNEGHDVWEIELNGGDNTECATCPDYTYQDQVDYFWPVLMAGVFNYSGKTQAHYIGHSNGCRVALSSLNSYSNGKNGSGWAFNTQTGLYDINISLPNRSVDKFFGVACPVTLNDITAFIQTVRFKGINNDKPHAGNLAMRDINQSNIKHLKLLDYANPLAQYAPDLILDFVRLANLNNENKISRNLMQFYNDLALSSTSSLSIPNINVSEMRLYNGKGQLFGGDGIVPFSDQAAIFDSVNIRNETPITVIFTTHDGIKDRSEVKNDIKEVLKK